MDDEQLKICFLVLKGQHFYTEYEIGLHLNEIRHEFLLGGFDYWNMEGAISIVYHEEELLGKEFWDIITQIYALPHQLIAGISRKEFLAYQSCWLSFSPQGERLLYELKSTTNSRLVHIVRSLPLYVFVREWSLMKFRLDKFAAYLGDIDAKKRLENWRNMESATTKWQQAVGVDLLDRIVKSDIEDIFLIDI